MMAGTGGIRVVTLQGLRKMVSGGMKFHQSRRMMLSGGLGVVSTEVHRGGMVVGSLRRLTALGGRRRRFLLMVMTFQP